MFGVHEKVKCQDRVELVWWLVTSLTPLYNYDVKGQGQPGRVSHLTFCSRIRHIFSVLALFYRAFTSNLI